MAGIFSWSSTPGSNTTVDGINIDEGCPAGNVNNALRSIMALVRTTFSSGLETFLAGSAALPVANGGTGDTTAAGARSNLSAAKSGANSDITSLSALSTALSIAQGGTGATSAAAALSALGIAYTSNANGQCAAIPISGATILVQWGSATSGNGFGGSGWSGSLTLPVSFSSTSTAAIVASPNDVRVTAADGNSVSAKLVSTSQYQIGSDDSVITCHWIAIGLG